MNTGELVHQLRLQLWNVTYARYLEQEIFSVQWWGIIVTLGIVYFIWWKVVDKTRLLEILLFGSYVAVSSAVIDIWGVTTAHWQYNIRIFPILPAPFPFDYTLVPILLMLSYQYGKHWGSYLGWSALASGLFSFGISPLFQATGIKSFYEWSFFYFFILMMGLAMLARYAMQLTVQTMEASRANHQAAPRHSAVLQPVMKPLSDEEMDNAKKNSNDK